MFDSNAWKDLTWGKEMNFGSFKKVTDKLFVYESYI